MIIKMTRTNTQIYKIKQLTPEQKEVIKASVPILEKAGVSLASEFYKYMLGTYTVVKPFFNETDQKLLRQPKILAFALLNYAKHIDDLSSLENFVKQIVVKHVGLQVLPEHYPIVGKCLLSTMEKMPGIDATDEFLEAWSIAYGNLAQILINAEHEVYEHNPWQGFRDFEVTKIESESSDVKSVYFTPTDGGGIAMPKRGQYVCIRWLLPGADFERSREYSLSEYPSDNDYRISVRHLENGVVSSFINNQLEVGSTIRVAPPSGQFVYDDSNETNELILFVGGIGITPLISITEYALSKGRNVTLIYSNRTVESRAFGPWLESLKDGYQEKFKLTEYFSKETIDVEPIDETHKRPLSPSDIDFVKQRENADFYVLGPRGYMRFVKSTLVEKGVKESTIRSEFFGPYEP